MLQLDQVSFSFKTNSAGTVAASTKSKTPLVLRDICITLAQGKIAGVMGESGCGKSTLLNLIYGLLQAQKGTISWQGKELKGADHFLVPGHSMMKYVPQEYNLMPYTSVFENVGEHLSIQRDDRSRRINELLDVVEMGGFAQRKVKTLSGGQKQRVAIAKALAQEPQLLLLDEPFSHVDNFRKNDLRRRLFSYLKKQGISAMIATHDRDDVLSFTDELIIMKNGAVQDHRATIEVYEKPRDFYTAALFSEVNLIPANFFQNKKERLAYPHELHLSRTGKAATVIKTYFKGDHYLMQCDCDGLELWVRSDIDNTLSTTIKLSLSAD